MPSSPNPALRLVLLLGAVSLFADMTYEAARSITGPYLAVLGVRTPARDTILSHATRTMGRGWGFGVHEAMDQVGAVIGPMIVTAVLAWKGSYRYGFAVLAFPALLAAIAASAWFAPLVFSSRSGLLLAGMTLWGIGMGAQESVLRATVADMVPPGRRATGYGVFNAGFGLAWFAGSALMGLLYERSITALAVFSVAAQLASLPLLRASPRKIFVGNYVFALYIF